MKHLYRSLLLVGVFAINIFFCQASDQIKEQINVKALKNEPIDWCLGVHFANSVPQKEFYSNLGNAGIGMMFNGGWWLKNSPLMLGGMLGFDVFSYDAHYYDSGSWWQSDDLMTTSCTEIPLALILRFQPTTNWLRPYFEGIAGGNFIITSSTYETDYDNISSDDKFSAAWIYGLGAGIDLRIANSVSSAGKHNTINLTFAINYYFGSKVKYYTVEANGEMNADFRSYKSETDQIVTLLGVTFGF